jgi:hypothetical protein
MLLVMFENEQFTHYSSKVHLIHMNSVINTLSSVLWIRYEIEKKNQITLIRKKNC